MIAIVVVALIVILTLLVFYGFYRFSSLVEKDKEQLFNISGNTEHAVVVKDLAHLPKILQDYLQKAGVLGKCKDCHLIMKQKGALRQKEGANWVTFTAKQFMTSAPIGFVWAAKAFPIFAKDKWIQGTGQVQLTLAGLWEIDKEASSFTNQSALNRCLAELVLYPVGFLNPAIAWEILDKKSVKATVSMDGISTSGVFHFSEEGLITHFQSNRYRSETLESFTGIMENYAMVSGFYIPTKLRAIWNLEDGDFEYFNCEILDYRID